ncbi:MAG: hypothetical protein IJ420_07890 [Lachnospiraceae bacterium]|nr:hypothetical protein [Lachnospiraceae bacterium]
MNRFILQQKKFVCLTCFTAITLFFCSCGKSVPSYIVPSAAVEAGSSFSAKDFLLEDGHTAEFSSEFSSLYVKEGIATINQLGEYSVSLTVDGKPYDITLTVQDTVPPVASARTITVCQGDSLTAEHCVTDIKDQTTVSCAFQTEPDLTQTGSVNSIVVLTDAAGNHTEVPVTITVLSTNECLQASYTIEAGERIPAAEELIAFNKTGKYITDISVINTSLIGCHTLELEIEEAVYSTLLIIEDTVAPTATVVPVTAYYGAAFPSADSFVSNIIDKGPVTVSYETDPGANVDTPTTVRIVLEDQAGNRTVYDGECSVAIDEEAPKFISVPEQLEADVNSTILWRAMVSAEDNSGIVDVSLDTTGVNLEKPGTYTACLIAKDSVGNETRQEVKLVLHDNSVTKEMMDQLCEKIIGKIIKEDMTTQEILYAVSKYVSSNVKYTSEGVHDDVRREAYLGLGTRQNGDCFTFMAASHELLSYLGYELQIVRRSPEFVKESGNHFWLLVNCGTAEEPLWYHHDSSPHSKPYNQETHMMTDAQVKAYTNNRNSNASIKHYYSYDTSLHPASATEIVVEWNIDSKYYE